MYVTGRHIQKIIETILIAIKIACDSVLCKFFASITNKICTLIKGSISKMASVTYYRAVFIRISLTRKHSVLS
jgi:hypothetical protein